MLPTTHQPESERFRPRVTLEEWLRIPEEQRAELIHGRLVYQAMPGPRHGRSAIRLGAVLLSSYDRPKRDDDERPGGWWLSSEVDLHIGNIGCRPDVLGWRRDRHPQLPEPDGRGLVVAVPDWICEILSPSTAHVDMGDKRRAYFEAGVDHYWLADPHNRTLAVLRRTEGDDYTVAAVAGRGAQIRLPPFGAVLINVDELFGDEEP